MITSAARLVRIIGLSSEMLHQSVYDMNQEGKKNKLDSS